MLTPCAISGDVRVREATVAELQASVAGSGDVRAAGRAAVLKVSVAGSGDVDLSGAHRLHRLGVIEERLRRVEVDRDATVRGRFDVLDELADVLDVEERVRIRAREGELHLLRAGLGNDGGRGEGGGKSERRARSAQSCGDVLEKAACVHKQALSG